MEKRKNLLVGTLGLVLLLTSCGQSSASPTPTEIGPEPTATTEPTATPRETENPGLDAQETLTSIQATGTNLMKTKRAEETIQSTDETDDEPDDSIPAMAYIGPDDNVWVLETGGQTPRQITFDANRTGGDRAEVVYLNPLLSSDGTLLVYYMDVGTPSANGHAYTHGVWVANLITGEHRQILEGRFSGMAWKPGTHLLAYGHEVDMDYSISRGESDTVRPKGIHTIDMDNGEIHYLVAPERGYALSSPNWSPDGRFLAFSESVSMEAGMFAYYDLENQEYVAWDEYVGRASWSPDGSLLTYDRIYYVPTGEERLYLRPRQGDEQLLGPDYDGPAYASQPVFSPAGDQIAYLARLEGPETDFATIMVLDLAGGEPKSLGQFEDVWEFSWVPDGSHLVFSFGLYPSRHIIALNISDGSQTMLAAGDQLTLAGQ
jgi:Tol biopolymer transport system component